MNKSKKLIISILTAALMVIGTASVSNAATCKDGTWSSSVGKGTCSWHGGLASTNSYGIKSYGTNSYSTKSYGNSYGIKSYSTKSYGIKSYGLNKYSSNNYGVNKYSSNW